MGSLQRADKVLIRTLLHGGQTWLETRGGEGGPGGGPGGPGSGPGGPRARSCSYIRDGMNRPTPL